MEDDLPMAVPADVSIILIYSLPLGTDTVGLHTVNTQRPLGASKQCRSSCSNKFRVDPTHTNQIAIIYLSVGGFAALSFVLCSYWVYHYVDLEHYDTLPEPEFREKRREEEQGAQDQGVMSSSAALGR